MVLPTVLRKRHSLKGIKLIPAIKKIRAGQPESLKEFARISKELRTEEMTLEDVGVHVKNLTGRLFIISIGNFI